MRSQRSFVPLRMASPSDRGLEKRTWCVDQSSTMPRADRENSGVVLDVLVVVCWPHPAIKQVSRRRAAAGFGKGALPQTTLEGKGPFVRTVTEGPTLVQTESIYIDDIWKLKNEINCSSTFVLFRNKNPFGALRDRAKRSSGSYWGWKN